MSLVEREREPEHLQSEKVMEQRPEEFDSILNHDLVAENIMVVLKTDKKEVPHKSVYDRVNSDTDSVKDETEPFKTQSVETNCIFIEKETRDSSGNINLQKTLFDIRDKAKKSEASARKENMETASEEDRISKKLKKNKTKK